MCFEIKGDAYPMSLLEQLAREAEEIKAQQRQEESERDQSRDRIVRTLMPRVRAAHGYFDKVKEHLAVLAPNLEASYSVPGIGEISGLKQGNYACFTDTVLEKMTRFTFRYIYASEQPVQKNVQHASVVANLRNYLTNNSLKFSIRDGKAGSGLFTIESWIPVSFEFSADSESNTVRLDIRNLRMLGVQTYNFAPEKIDRSFVDEIAKCALHQPNRLGELTGNFLAESARVRLRVTLEEAKRRREAVQAIDELPADPLPKPSLMHKLGLGAVLGRGRAG